MNVILDGIIFSLQRAGGISVVFGELLSRFIADPDMQCHVIEYGNENMFRRQITIPEKYMITDQRAWMPLTIKRYINPRLTNKYKQGIFHSSYYRTAKNTTLANITTVHDFTYEYYRNGLPLKVHHAQKACAIRKSQKIICVSEHTKRDLLRFFPQTNENNISVIYHGVDDAYHPVHVAAKNELNKIAPYSPGEYVLFVGDRSTLYKNFRLAAESAKIVRVPLIVAGGGPIKNREQALLDELLGAGNYHHIPYPDNKMLNLLYNHALCLLYPSLYEGFGMPVAEAQKAGCPVIACASSSIPEIAGTGALLLSTITAAALADAIRQLRNSSSLSNDLKKKGFSNAERFSWAQSYAKIKALYASVY